MTASSDFLRSAGIAASPLQDFPGLSFTFAGQAIHFGSMKEIGPCDVSIYLSMQHLRKPEISNVMGLICFLADVRGVNLILDFLEPSDDELLQAVQNMLLLNGYALCRESFPGGGQVWCRLAQSIAA